MAYPTAWSVPHDHVQVGGKLRLMTANAKEDGLQTNRRVFKRTASGNKLLCVKEDMKVKKTLGHW